MGNWFVGEVLGPLLVGACVLNFVAIYFEKMTVWLWEEYVGYFFLDLVYCFV